MDVWIRRNGVQILESEVFADSVSAKREWQKIL